MGRGSGFSPGTCMQHTLQADPTVILDKFPFSWLAHWKTLFTPSFVWKERCPHRWLLFSCHSCSFLHYPQVKSRLAKKPYPRFRRKLSSKNILLLLSKLGMQLPISYFIGSQGIVLLFLFGCVSMQFTCLFSSEKRYSFH